MGYSIYLADANKKPITEEVVEEMIKTMPPYMLGFAAGMRQPWGWSLATDLSLDNGTIKVSGSFSGSGKLALDMTLRIQQALRKHGYDLIVTSRDFNIGDYEKEEEAGFNDDEVYFLKEPGFRPKRTVHTFRCTKKDDDETKQEE